MPRIMMLVDHPVQWIFSWCWSDLTLSQFQMRDRLLCCVISNKRGLILAYIDPATGKKLVFLTNLMDVSAFTVCLLYKDRWTIEPLFKQVKQNFELTYFLSDSPEGIKTQIWIALILNLIFTAIHKIIKEAENFATMVKLAAKNTSAYAMFPPLPPRVREGRMTSGKLSSCWIPKASSKLCA